MPTGLTVRTPTLEIGYEASRGRHRLPRRVVARVPGRCPRLGRRGPSAGGGWISGAGAVSARLRADPLPRCRGAAHGAAGSDCPGSASISWRRWVSTRVGSAGYDWGGRAACITAILAPERVQALVTIGGYNVQNTLVAQRTVCGQAGACALVPMVLQYRAGPGRPRAASSRYLPTPLGGMVADLAFRRRHLRAHGLVL